MHYNIAPTVGKTYVRIKKMIHYGDKDETGIPESVGNKDEIQFLIPIRYG